MTRCAEQGPSVSTDILFLHKDHAKSSLSCGFSRYVILWGRAGELRCEHHNIIENIYFGRHSELALDVAHDKLGGTTK